MQVRPDSSEALRQRQRGGNQLAASVGNRTSVVPLAAQNAIVWTVIVIRTRSSRSTWKQSRSSIGGLLVSSSLVRSKRVHDVAANSEPPTPFWEP